MGWDTLYFYNYILDKRPTQTKIAGQGLARDYRPPPDRMLYSLIIYSKNIVLYRYYRDAIMGKILLFYKYVDIVYPVQVLKWQKKLCADLGLTGRIILAHEGINGTVGGSDEHTELYKKAMSKHPYFGGIDFKESPGDETYFPKMRIVVKNEIVNLGLDPKEITAHNGGAHLTPQEVHELLSNKPKDLVILDARNAAESRVGTFTDALTPPIDNFRQLPQYIDENLEQFKDKDVFMFCTGGIRCERASAYLKSKGVASNVYQLEGGIHRYAEQFPDGFFRGKNYVFDGRVTVTINNDILSNCDLCALPCNEYTNCFNAHCNNHFIACPSCVEKFGNTCSARCHELLVSKQVPMRPPFKKQPEIASCNAKTSSGELR